MITFALSSLSTQHTVFDAPPRAQSNEEEDETPREEAVWVAAEISRLLREERLDNGDPIRPCDVAILVRNKSHGTAYTEELNKLSTELVRKIYMGQAYILD